MVWEVSWENSGIVTGHGWKEKKILGNKNNASFADMKKDKILLAADKNVHKLINVNHLQFSANVCMLCKSNNPD